MRQSEHSKRCALQAKSIVRRASNSRDCASKTAARRPIILHARSVRLKKLSTDQGHYRAKRDKADVRRMTCRWEFQFHAVGMTVPRRGTHSPRLWDSQFHALGLTVPSPGTRSPKPYRTKRLAEGTERAQARRGMSERLAGVNEVEKKQRCDTHLHSKSRSQSPGTCPILIHSNSRMLIPDERSALHGHPATCR